MLMFLTLIQCIIAEEIQFDWNKNLPAIQSEWDEIWKETFGLWNNISRFQDFGHLQARTSELVESIDEMIMIYNKDRIKYADSYPEFFELSSNYLSILKKNIEQLELILGMLYKKSKDINAYSWSEYQKDIDKYNGLVNRYHLLGNKMNNSFKRIEEGNP